MAKFGSFINTGAPVLKLTNSRIDKPGTRARTNACTQTHTVTHTLTHAWMCNVIKSEKVNHIEKLSQLSLITTSDNACRWHVTGQPLCVALTHWVRDKMTAIFQTTFSNAFSWMKMYEFRLKFVPKGPINNIPALVQIMAWRRPGDKPLSEPMMVSLLTHICVTRLQWVNCRYGA